MPGTEAGISCDAKAKNKSPYKVTDKEVDAFFGKSAIIGNSVGLGLKYYFNTKPKGYLGGPTMLVWGSYSFLNDFNSYQKFMIHYKGQPVKARYAIQQSRKKHVFICMGTNDFNSSQHHIYEHYKRYIGEIKKTNPDVDIYILSTTPCRKSSGLLNNHETNKLNKQMKKYAEKHSDMYYIDINAPLKGSDGLLKASYASDGFVHLTMPAYKVWTDTMVKSVKKLLKGRKKASVLVKNARQKLTQKSYDKAKTAVAGLDKSEFKKKLKEKLKKIKIKLKKKLKKEKELKELEKEKAGAGDTAAPSVVGGATVPGVPVPGVPGVADNGANAGAPAGDATLAGAPAQIP